MVEEVYARGWKTVKLYFMIGHPSQTLDDVAAIVDLAAEVRTVGRRALGRKAQVNVSVSTLVPKPHTPFQWVPLADEADIRTQQEYLKDHLRGPGLKLNWNIILIVNHYNVVQDFAFRDIHSLHNLPFRAH